MLYLRLFLIFLKIGIFTFGGGYAMVSLIENEVVEKQQWLTHEEFTDILAISQSTPGPIGINTATFAGHMACRAEGMTTQQACLGAVVASLAVILLPVILMLAVASFLFRHKDNLDINNIFRALRITVIGLIAAAALSLFTSESFGTAGLNRQFVASVAIFAVVFLLALIPQRGVHWGRFTLPRLSPILLLLLSGLAGFLIYYL